MHITNQDNYGWYEVGPTRYYNKIEAVLAHNRARLPIRWNYNDQVYDQFQWDLEPTQSLTELYAARAWGLRNKYDYLVLHFSGGSDSANILETFIQNGIHLDEILVRGSFGQVDKQLTGRVTAADQYAECLTQAVPLAQWAKDTHYPHLRISLVDTTSIIIDYFKNTPDWAEHDLTTLHPGQAFKTDLNRLCPHYVDLLEKGKRVAHIYGADKPQIFKENNIFYTRWLDELARSNRMSHCDSVDIPRYAESFYWSPDAVLLQIKQLHQIKNYIKQHNVPDHMFDTAAGRAYDNFIAAIIYRRTLPLIIEHLKNSSLSIIHDRDMWFGKHSNNDAYTNWKQGVEHLSTIIPKEWHQQSNLFAGGIKNLWSKPRYLGS